ncbi:MAG: response regulator [Gemmatimonadaceae bacterium]
MTVPPSRAKLMAALAGIWERSRDAILERVTVVEDAAMALVAGTLSTDARRHAEQEAHKLAGTAGTFGYHEATDLAREAEQLLAGDRELGRAEMLRLSQIAVRLRDLLEQPMELAPQREANAPGQPAEVAVVVWSTDEGAVKQLVAALGARNCHAVVVDSEAAAQAILTPRTAFMVDLTDDAPARWDALERVHAREPERVLLACAGAEEFTNRIRAARAGVKLFLEASSDPAVMAAEIADALERAPEVQRTVIVVDDDPYQLAALESMLNADHFAVTALSDPLALWPALTRVRPDLVVLDIDMPGATGLELCRAIRASSEWSGLVVIVVSARAGNDVGALAFAAGADDFIPKPFSPQELLARIGRQEWARRSTRDASKVPAPTEVRVSATEEYDVVIVDDDAVLVELLMHSLASRGYRTLSIGDGAAATKQLGGSVPSVRAKVIVLDVGLPGQDGFTVLRLLNRDGVTRTSRVIMLTLRSTEREVVEALELGAVDHVAKPFSIPVLMQRIRRAVEQERPQG